MRRLCHGDAGGWIEGLRCRSWKDIGYVVAYEAPPVYSLIPMRRHFSASGPEKGCSCWAFFLEDQDISGGF